MKTYIFLQFTSILFLYPFEKNFTTTLVDGTFLYLIVLIVLALIQKRGGKYNLFFNECDNDAIRAGFNVFIMVIMFVLEFIIRFTLYFLEDVYLILALLQYIIAVVFNIWIIYQSTIRG